MAKKIKVSPDQPSLIKQEVPQMPEGYYSGDKPNPNLRSFVEEHIKEKPYDPENDDYNVPAFNKPITTTKATAIYNMHTYWSKKPHDAIRQYINHYTKPGDLVLDPFCGSGGTALAALMEGRKAIAIDRSPAATFITKNYCTPVDTEELQRAFEELKAKIQPEIDWLYETKCDRCGGKAITEYTVYSQVFQCPRCLEKFALFDCIEVIGETSDGKEKKINACPICFKNGVNEEISTRSKKYGSIPVHVCYSCENGCNPKRNERSHNDKNKTKREYFNKYDIGKLNDINNGKIPYWYPSNEFPKDFHLYKRCALHLYQINNVSDLFTKRNLWALSIIKEKASHIVYGDIFNFGLTAVIIALSRMQRYSPNSGFPNMVLTGTYYIPSIGREIEAFSWYCGKIKSLIKGFNNISILSKSIIISTSDATNINIPSNSVDYIFTDPPYTDKIFYGELNLIWESWLKHDLTWVNEEIVVKPDDVFTIDLWNNRMKAAFQECYRILKPGRSISICFHGKTIDWQIVQDLMSEIGFISEQARDALFIETKQKSYRQLTAEDNTLRDLVINFRKPQLGEVSSILIITGDENKTSFNEKFIKIINEYLTINPGSTKDRIYDEVVSRMVRAGTMEAHNFEELLKQVADEIREPVKKNLYDNKDPNLFGTHEISRWYLKETELDITDSAESAKEDAAAEIVSEFIEKYLKKHKGIEGVHYSDLFEQYIYSVKDKPRRQLSDWLLDYFYKTDEGTYRLPASEEEKQLKAEGRSKGTLRRVRRYLAFLEQGVAVPDRERPNDATLAEWIRHCKRSGLFAQGKLLYEKGGINIDALPEEIMVGVEEDYQVCARMLSRDSEKKSRKSQ